MSFPDRVPVHKVESLLYGFRIDHQSCSEGDKPVKGLPEIQAATPKLQASTRPS
jgi:hypothetical protein